MPSALERLAKILRLEREQRYRDRAVEGGLGEYSRVWEPEARREARNAGQLALVEELRDAMQRYKATEGRKARAGRVKFMLERIHSRSSSQARGAGTSSRRERRGAERQAGGQGRRQERSSANRASRKLRPSMPDLAPRRRLERAPRQPRKPYDAQAAEAVQRELEQPVTALRGVGERKAEAFARLGVNSVGELLYFLPRRHDDYRQVCYLGRLKPGMQVTVVGRVRSTALRVVAGGRHDFQLTLEDDSGELDAIFFGRRWMEGQIKVGEQIVLRGQVAAWGSRLQMSGPEWEPLDSDTLQTVGLVPVYALREGLRQREVRRLVRGVVDALAERVPDPVPEASLERCGLADLGWALRQAHFPEGPDQLRHARERLLYDELLQLQLAVLGARREWQEGAAAALCISDEALEVLQEALFPFRLTDAQRRAVAEIRADMATTVPMNRLLQGDVGSGKTAVATLALALTVLAGKQAALIVPLSVLAEQHYRSLVATMARMPAERKPSVALLSGATPRAEREALLEDLATGALDIVIGTQALIQEGVRFHDLGLAIIDEQHRFGVQQRKALRGKGRNPHLLMMSATPIPRSLALTLHADLDLTVIDELPPGRVPVQTCIIEPVARERALSFVAAELARGRQAFIVHALVQESEQSEARAAIEAQETLRQVFHQYRVALLHGRMSAAEKEETLRAYSRGEQDVLVTTSVAEVGVDVPNASVMVIEGANRFGLAQLHQFRGRVGRGEHASTCLLIPDREEPASRQRLEVLVEIRDGFRLAELDWELRGPGDLVGTRQSGGNLTQMAGFLSPELVALAQRESRSIYAEDPELSLAEHKLLGERVARLRDARSDIS